MTRHHAPTPLGVVDRSPARDAADARRRLLDAAAALGFPRAGLAPARVGPDDVEHLERWLERGDHASMHYLAARAGARGDAASHLPGARSVLVVALPYTPELDARPAGPGRGRVSCYARGDDYHRVMGERLAALEELAEDLLPGARARRFSDTAPVLDRAFARRAGLGFFGKNTCLIDTRIGSYFFIGGVAIDRELPEDPVEREATCGTCTLCLDACPTGAIPEPYRVDARRCIAYLTVEHRGPYDETLRARVGDHVYGCDICQAVCPWNQKFAPPGDPELAPRPELSRPVLLELLERALRQWKRTSRRSALSRGLRRGVLRNLATAMGNDPATVGHREALERLALEEDEGVREHARWGLRREETTGHLGGVDRQGVV